ncbi:MAG: hypothetical protein B7733_18705 [Myxococcales bacterium FL481]|nr:MAG: hypothetical protein B7733_18705 [Myxococcales bacterium FL481]
MLSSIGQSCNGLLNAKDENELRDRQTEIMHSLALRQENREYTRRVSVDRGLRNAAMAGVILPTAGLITASVGHYRLGKANAAMVDSTESSVEIAARRRADDARQLRSLGLVVAGVGAAVDLSVFTAWLIRRSATNSSYRQYPPEMKGL